MDVVVRGKNVHISESLRDSALEKIGRLDRYANGSGRAVVDFSELRNKRIHENQVCEVLLHLEGKRVRARAASLELSAALDLVSDKLDHQVKKLKDKRVGRSHPRHPMKARQVRHEEATAIGDGEIVADDEVAPPPRIIGARQFAVKPMPPEEAVAQLGLLGRTFLLFTNSETSRAAVIYRRDDGDFGLIDAEG